MLLGAHMSIAGGVDKAIERGMSLSCTTIQLFTKNSNQWKGKPVTGEEAGRFKALRKKSGIRQVIAHDSYLINLASGDPELREKSIDALISGMVRSRILEIPYIIAHPGAHTGIGEDEGIKNDRIGGARRGPKAGGCLNHGERETPDGEGTNIGYG